jgi:bacteriocin resistance YdeI/OmpD-like protein
MDLLTKLRVKADEPLWLINAPANCFGLFPRLEIKEKLPAKKMVDQMILFAHDSKELNHYFPAISEHVSPDTLLWIFYPKKAGSITSDLIEMNNWDIVFKSGYRGQTSVSVNDDWTGFRITNAPKKAPTICDVPMEERKVEGIDFVNRTVTLPVDAIAVLGRYKGMVDFFNTMSFTHKKEHVMAIVDAKKEETRMRRIDKMAEMLQQKMMAKKQRTIN